jgi:hypothetical protein
MSRRLIMSRKLCLPFRKLLKLSDWFCRISGKVQVKDKNETPGPGEYKVVEKVIEGPKFGFGTGPRVI